MEKQQNSDKLKQDRRRAFRVDDVLPMVSRKIDPNQPRLGTRILPGFSEDYLLPEAGDEPPGEGVNLHVWRLLLQIHNRLGLILNKLDLDEQGVAKAEPTEVSLSTTGAKFTTRERYAAGDLLELKILLPLDPPSWIVSYGEVVRSSERKGGPCETAVQFLDTDDAVIEAINRYGLKRQRELIRKRKGD
jgi:hypothetical protein